MRRTTTISTIKKCFKKGNKRIMELDLTWQEEAVFSKGSCERRVMEVMKRVNHQRKKRRKIGSKTWVYLERT